jgi:alkylation response protein AidB-like acyl-CoA dehydrogenase
MRFVLSDDQTALAAGMRALCAGRFALDRLRNSESKLRTFDPAEWAELGRAGAFAIRSSEEHGGLGLGMVESVVVFEELGRALVPGPLVAQALSAGIIDGAIDGTSVVGSVRRPPSGFPAVIPHLGALSSLVVVGEDGLSVVDPSSLDAKPAARALDPLTPIWVVEGELPVGEPLGGAGAAEGWSYGENLLSAALCVGIAAATLEMAVAYSKDREQFGRPVGSFQAIKHICADMLVRSELARVAVQAAAVVADDPETGDPIRSAAGATLLGIEAAVENSRKCIQVHGGVGFTWELPVHLYLMRARVLEAVCRAGGDLANTVAERV